MKRTEISGQTTIFDILGTKTCTVSTFLRIFVAAIYISIWHTLQKYSKDHKTHMFRRNVPIYDVVEHIVFVHNSGPSSFIDGINIAAGSRPPSHVEGCGQRYVSIYGNYEGFASQCHTIQSLHAKLPNLPQRLHLLESLAVCLMERQPSRARKNPASESPT